MTTVLEWATLVVCCAVLLLRVPDAVKGRNRTVFGILLLATLCSLLAVSGPYEAIDGMLGGWNVTNLIQRYLVFAMALLIGLRISKGLGATWGYRFIAGRPGQWALGISCVAIGLIFLLMDTSGSSAGLEDLPNTGRNAVLGPLYAAAGRSYPAFVSVVLVPPLVEAIRSRLPPLVRAGAFATFLGAVAVVLTVPASFSPPAMDLGQHLANYLAVLGYVLGLGLFWFAGLIAQPRGKARATFRKKTP